MGRGEASSLEAVIDFIDVLEAPEGGDTGLYRRPLCYNAPRRFPYTFNWGCNQR